MILAQLSSYDRGLVLEHDYRVMLTAPNRFNVGCTCHTFTKERSQLLKRGRDVVILEAQLEIEISSVGHDCGILIHIISKFGTM